LGTHPDPWDDPAILSTDRLRRQLAEPRFREKVRVLLEAKRVLETSASWFQKAHSESTLTATAYFSMEYLLSAALPIYAGGLGNVTGDQLKAASDLNAQVIGIGLLYQQGYFRQEIDACGTQIARYPFNRPNQLPVTPLRNAAGDWLRLKGPSARLHGVDSGMGSQSRGIGGSTCSIPTTPRTGAPALSRGTLSGGDAEVRISGPLG
jgi:glucan phosphorylase